MGRETRYIEFVCAFILQPLAIPTPHRKAIEKLRRLSKCREFSMGLGCFSSQRMRRKGEGSKGLWLLGFTGLTIFRSWTLAQPQATHLHIYEANILLKPGVVILLLLISQPPSHNHSPSPNLTRTPSAKLYVATCGYDKWLRQVGQSTNKTSS